VIDPLERWKALGLPDKPDYAGLLTFGGLPYTQDPGDLSGVDVAVVGAPTDDLVSDRPGTRFGPRAIRAASCPPGPHLEAKVDALSELRVVDYGDAPVIPADPERTHVGVERVVRESGPSPSSGRGRRSSRSTSTCSTRRSRPARARPSRAG